MLTIPVDPARAIGRACVDRYGVELASLDAAVDLDTPGLFAFQATFVNGLIVHFLIVDVAVDRVTAGDLVETTYHQWPPPCLR